MRALVVTSIVVGCGGAPRSGEPPPASPDRAAAGASAPTEPAPAHGSTPSRDPADWPLACKRLAADALPVPGTEAEAAAHLASSHELLGISDPCDDAPWVEMQRATPGDEALYCVLTMIHHDCRKDTEAIGWAERRVAAFPRSVDAHRTLALLILGLVISPDGTGMPDESLPPGERITWIDRALERLETAHGVGLEAGEYHLFASIALTQRSLAHVVVPAPRSAAEELAVIQARTDTYRAWEHQQAVCDANGQRTCAPNEIARECCPRKPLSDAQRRADEKRLRVLERSVAR